MSFADVEQWVQFVFERVCLLVALFDALLITIGIECPGGGGVGEAPALVKVASIRDR